MRFFLKIASITAIATPLSLASPIGVTMADDAPAFMPDQSTTALLITDPQNDFMSETGAAWGLVGENVTRLGTNVNIERLMSRAKETGVLVVVSPHTYFGHDDHWHDRGPIQSLMNQIGMFRVDGPTSYDGFEGSGSDFFEPLRVMINDGETIITSPHKVYGPESNDLVLQLRQRGVQTVLLGGFAANLCTDSHMRELVEQGFSVIVINDAVGAPGEAAYEAAMLNADMIANAVWSTDDAVAFLE